jgi:hypothetical protein
MAKSFAEYENGVLALTLTRAAEPRATKQLTVQQHRPNRPFRLFLPLGPEKEEMQ